MRIIFRKVEAKQRIGGKNCSFRYHLGFRIADDPEDDRSAIYTTLISIKNEDSGKRKWFLADIKQKKYCNETDLLYTSFASSYALAGIHAVTRHRLNGIQPTRELKQMVKNGKKNYSKFRELGFSHDELSICNTKSEV